MRAFAILPAVAAAVMAINISTASSQGACMQEYQACMDGCTGRSSRTLQDTCFTSCEGRNNMCAERVYGKRPFNGSPANAAVPSGQAKDALAKTEKESAQPQPADQEPAREQRAPARR